eukprot:6582142-Ditylum_brightwellii.AAC.1
MQHKVEKYHCTGNVTILQDTSMDEHGAFLQDGQIQIIFLQSFPCTTWKEIRYAMHPDGGQHSTNGNKCHQLRHFICTFKRKARKIFHLGPNAPFDEGGVPMQSRFCPVRQYNKDKPDKFR